MTASQNPDRRPENHPTTHDTLPPLERRVMIYLGGGLVWVREQAAWVHVFRWPYAQYADAFRIHFKPRRKRLLRECVDYHGSTVIVDGWNHPHVLPRILLPRGEATLAPLASSVTIGGPAATDMNIILDRYIRSLPPADIILDLRGQLVSTGRKWS